MATAYVNPDCAAWTWILRTLGCARASTVGLPGREHRPRRSRAYRPASVLEFSSSPAKNAAKESMIMSEAPTPDDEGPQWMRYSHGN